MESLQVASYEIRRAACISRVICCNRKIKKSYLTYEENVHTHNTPYLCFSKMNLSQVRLDSFYVIVSLIVPYRFI